MFKLSVTLLPNRQPTIALYLSMLFYLVATAQAKIDTQPSPNGSLGEFCNRLPCADYQDLERVDDPDSWFQVYNVATGVKAIYEPHQ
ncbi:MAG: hypothetical protein ACJARN_001206 [Arenicella sp.]|jgi:hypothetical protein